jgi:hypothetical protein
LALELLNAPARWDALTDQLLDVESDILDAEITAASEIAVKVGIIIKQAEIFDVGNLVTKLVAQVERFVAARA